jgi:hypothetical protein
MLKTILPLTLPLILACGATFPPPTQRMADAEAAERSARELGASGQQQAQLSIKLAQEQIAQARKAMKKGDNERANGLLIRAKADAELALAQTRETTARGDTLEAIDDSAAQNTTNDVQGAIK